MKFTFNVKFVRCYLVCKLKILLNTDVTSLITKFQVNMVCARCMDKDLWYGACSSLHYTCIDEDIFRIRVSCRSSLFISCTMILHYFWQNFICGLLLLFYCQLLSAVSWGDYLFLLCHVIVRCHLSSVQYVFYTGNSI